MSLASHQGRGTLTQAKRLETFLILYIYIYEPRWADVKKVQKTTDCVRYLAPTNTIEQCYKAKVILGVTFRGYTVYLSK